MQNKFPTIKDRILYLAEIKGFGKKNFCEKIGMSYGSFTGQAKNTPLNSNAIANILCIVPDVNLHWLLTGMLLLLSRNWILRLFVGRILQKTQ